MEGDVIKGIFLFLLFGVSAGFIKNILNILRFKYSRDIFMLIANILFLVLAFYIEFLVIRFL